MERTRIESSSPLGWRSPAVTVGNFDGVHRGTQALVSAAVAWARGHDAEAVVLTFDPHPARVLAPGRAPGGPHHPRPEGGAPGRAGSGPPGRGALRPGVARLSAGGVLPAGARRERSGRGTWWSASPSGSGTGREGDAARLAAVGEGLGFSVRPLPPVLERGAPVSSSRVREALLAGDVRAARRSSGGRTSSTLPSCGATAAGGRSASPPPTSSPRTRSCRRGASTPPAAASPGPRGATPWSTSATGPRSGEATPTVEAHLIGFDGDLYGTRVRLEFHERLRGEERFSGPEALVARIRDDVARARALLSTAPSREGIVGSAR
jgi:riboflavin kinase / FMN adenylyltransferase